VILQPFTHPLQRFTIKMLCGNVHPISLVHRFTQSIKVMNITYSLAGFLLFQSLLCNQATELPEAFQPETLQNPGNDSTENLLIRSVDGGQTWDDVSERYPKPLKDDPSGSYWGVHVRKADGTNVWSPVFDDVQDPRIRTVFETAGGAMFIGTNKGFFKTDNNGETWKQVYAGGLVGNLAESDGVLLSTSMGKIIRSTDHGENWAPAVSQDSVAFDIKPIKGGFAAITSESSSGKRRLSASYDGGKTWEPMRSDEDKVFIDSILWKWGYRPHLQLFTTSIVQLGKDFLCTHPDGIFKSSDQGKTWKLVLPSIKGKVFNVSVSGDVVYAVPRKAGC
jgi:photosystem II stability/assembly factor-like uncharacterized protein